MGDRRLPRPENANASKRYIPVRSSTAAARPVSASRIPRPIPQRGPVGAVDPRGSRGGGRAASVRQQAPARQTAPVQEPPPPEPQPPPPQQPAPRQPSGEMLGLPDAAVDVESIIPSRQARPPISAIRRSSQVLPLPPYLQAPMAAGGSPLTQPNYELDWLPQDDLWLNKELAIGYTNEAVEVMKGHQLRAAKHEVAEGIRENEVLYKMLESGVPYDVIDKFLENKGYEEDEAEKRETEHFEKLEQMIADEAHDIDLALTMSRFDLEKNPKRETRLEFEKSGRVQHQKQRFQRGLRSVRKGIEAMSVLAEEDEPEEVQPELAAAMMYTEECGPGMTNPPNDMFAFLFSHQPDIPAEQLGEAGPLVAQEGAELVPTAPAEVAEQRSGRLMVREGSGATPPPGRPIPNLPAHFVAGTGGAAPMPFRPQYGWRSGRECRRSEITKRFNLVQMCGSHPPFWFRGYFEAFPHTLGRIAISKSPSATLQTAWYLTRPETYKMNRRLMVQAV